MRSVLASVLLVAFLALLAHFSLAIPGLGDLDCYYGNKTKGGYCETAGSRTDSACFKVVSGGKMRYGCVRKEKCENKLNSMEKCLTLAKITGKDSKRDPKKTKLKDIAKLLRTTPEKVEKNANSTVLCCCNSEDYCNGATAVCTAVKTTAVFVMALFIHMIL